MTAPVLASLAVPTNPDALPAIEEVIETLIERHPDVLRPHAIAMRLGAIEGARFGFCSDDTGGAPRIGLVTVYTPANSIRRLRLEFNYPGRGIPLGGIHAPYPFWMVGQDYLLHRIQRQEIRATVVDEETVLIRVHLAKRLAPGPDSIQLLAEGEDPRRAHQAILLLMLCRSWETVRLIVRPVEGMTLQLEEPRRTRRRPGS